MYKAEDRPDYSIKAPDRFNWIITRKHTAKTKTGELVEKEITIGYYPKLTQALKALRELSAKDFYRHEGVSLLQVIKLSDERIHALAKQIESK